MKKLLIFSFSFIIFTLTFGQKQEPEINVIHGTNHIYTIETPTGWINDREAAESIGLTNFFYDPNDPNDGKRAYMYTKGYDKLSQEENLDSFVSGDLEDFIKKYPSAQYEKVKLDFEPPIIGGLALTFSDLPDRFKEEVIYLETKETIIILSFAAFNEEDYNKYVAKFDKEFVTSFIYRGNDPKPFLEWLEQNK